MASPENHREPGITAEGSDAGAPASGAPRHSGPTGGLPALSLAALGIVFGDIGTSPLYTLKTVLALAGAKPDPAVILGSLSLVIWTLIIVVAVKYVSVAMRIDNDGEGGILALMSLLGVKRDKRPAIVAVGLAAAALMYGDGAITPAISVLSALEGLEIAIPSSQSYVLPLAVFVLIALFAIQPLGTAKIGRTFGPVMALWFLVIGGLGVWGILRHPSVLQAIDPTRGISYLFSNGTTGFMVLGGVFLCVTGAEALYADMGHFSARPIRFAWFALVFPSLLLNYAGQAALVLEGAPISDNIFFRLCPEAFVVPLVLLATVATIIASQSIITGTFSMTRQAIQLGWMPRFRITQTSPEGYGQIYVGAVNWLLMIVTVGLAIGFRKSDNLAAAYGVAVSATMLMTSGLLFIAMREILQWSLPVAAVAAGAFLMIDGGFAAANMAKLAEGGYVPLILGSFIYAIMWIWHWGMQATLVRMHETAMPIETFCAQLATAKIARVEGTAVYLTRTPRDVPAGMVWQVKQIRALHEQLFVVTVISESIPWVHARERLTFNKVAPGFWRATARFGFMQQQDIPVLLRQAHAEDNEIDLSDVTYFVGHGTVVPHENATRWQRWIQPIFSFMLRNSVHASDYFRLPADSVVEVGRQIVI
jgi:KUP system potassium uptake protein